MSILNELQDRLYHSAIAGVQLMDEDFRLKKIVTQFETVSQSNPVFQKIWQQLSNLLSRDCKNKADTLVSTIALIDAVVIAQAGNQLTAGTENNDEIQDLCLVETASISQYKYSELKPLHDALTTTGSGRYECVNEAFTSKNPVLQDYRLRDDLILALNDGYTEMVTLVKKILCSTKDERLVPLLKKGFLVKGGKSMVRRLEIIEELAKEKENAFYLLLTAADSSADLKEEAVRALRFEPDNLERLQELSKIEKGNIKKAALYILVEYFEFAEMEEFWVNYIKKTKNIAEPFYTFFINNKKVSEQIGERLDTMLTELLEQIQKKDPQNTNSISINYTLVDNVLSAMANQTSEKIISFLKRVGENAKLLSSIKERTYVPNFNSPLVGNKPFLDLINELMFLTMLKTMDRRYIEEARTFYQKYGTPFLKASVYAEFLLEPDHVFDKFETYIKESKKGAQFLEVLAKISYDEGEGQYYFNTAYYYQNYYDSSLDLQRAKIDQSRPIAKRLDPRLIKAFIEKKGEKADTATYILERLINPDDEETLPLFRDYFLDLCKKDQNTDFIGDLIRCKHKDFSEIGYNYVKKGLHTSFSYLHFFIDIYSKIPISREQLLKELRCLKQEVENESIIFKEKSKKREPLLEFLLEEITKLETNHVSELEYR